MVHKLLTVLPSLKSLLHCIFEVRKLIFYATWPLTISLSNGYFFIISGHGVISLHSLVLWYCCNMAKNKRKDKFYFYLLMIILPLASHEFGFCNRYLPTILLLRHFDVFRDLGSHEGSPNDQLGVPSEVASVIRKYTKLVTEDDGSNSKGEPNVDFVRFNYLLCPFLLLLTFYHILI